jgi:hypothetical protein
MRQFAALIVGLLLPSLATAHGGLPISRQILFRGSQLVVPTQFWGVFIGSNDGEWRWICEEAINTYQKRVFALGGDGTFYATDDRGVTVSRDGGCTWVSSTGELAARATPQVVADPVEPQRAWAVTSAGSPTPWNALFSTVDSGATWTPVWMTDERLQGVQLSPDGQTIYVSALAAAPDGGLSQPRLHVSRDRGTTFSAGAVDLLLAGVAPTLVPLGVDPADPSVVYLDASTDTTEALVRATGWGAQLTELFRADEIAGVAFDAGRGAVLAATRTGIWRSVDGGPFAPSGNLSRAQCVAVSGDTVYACGWNYAPDEAAVARSDDGVNFVKVFQYADTAGLTSACGDATPVGMTCPMIWRDYRIQLGAGVDLGPPGPGPSPDGCAVGRRDGGGLVVGAATLLALALALGAARRR